MKSDEFDDGEDFMSHLDVSSVEGKLSTKSGPAKLA
jgi:hypothetical protein